MFKIEIEYYLELSTPKTMKLLGSTRIKRTKNVHNLELLKYH